MYRFYCNRFIRNYRKKFNIPVSRKFNILNNFNGEIYKIFVKNCSTDTFLGLYDNASIQKYLDFIETNYTKLCTAQPHNKEHLEVISSALKEKRKIEAELSALNCINAKGDGEMKKLIEEEKKKFLNNINEIKNTILQNIVPLDDELEKYQIEIRIIPGIGGDEAKLFAEELYNMYFNYGIYNDWTCEIAEFESKSGGFLLFGNALEYDKIKNEAGVHRVQRIPATEKSGRTHTSTCSVTIYKKPIFDDIVIKESDCVIETTTSSKPGGQNVNKVETKVRIKHIPTGIVVVVQDSRHQYENKAAALKKLKNIISDNRLQQATTNKKSLIKEQAGTNDYSDKIRTYHYLQNRITDHRINFSTHHITGFLSGGKELNTMMNKVREFKKKEEILNYVQKILNSTTDENFSVNTK